LAVISRAIAENHGQIRERGSVLWGPLKIRPAPSSRQPVLTLATLLAASAAVVCGNWVLPGLGVVLGLVALLIPSAVVTGWLPS
jgi:hypothetical protein